MIYGFLDESGAPGVAAHNNDWLVISLVIFESEKYYKKAIEIMEKLKDELKLPDDYEFHCSSNSIRVQREVFKILPSIVFSYLTVAIKKNDFRKTASYTVIAKMLIDEVAERYKNIKIEMDSNPILYTEIRRIIKEQKYYNIKIRERNSKSNRLLQIADYIVNISAKNLKNPSSSLRYKAILKKSLKIIKKTS